MNNSIHPNLNNIPPIKYSIKNHGSYEFRLSTFCMSEKLSLKMVIQAWEETKEAFPHEASMMLDIVPENCCLEKTGFTKLTIVVNNPSPLHYDYC